MTRHSDANEIHQCGFIRDGTLPTQYSSAPGECAKTGFSPGTFSTTPQIPRFMSGCRIRTILINTKWKLRCAQLDEADGRPHYHPRAPDASCQHASAIANQLLCTILGKGSYWRIASSHGVIFVGAGLSGNRNSLVNCVVACHGNSGDLRTGEGHLSRDAGSFANNIDRYDPSWHCGGAKLIPKFDKGRIIGNEFEPTTSGRASGWMRAATTIG